LNPKPTTAILLFAHGARDPGWAEPFRRMAGRLTAAQPAVRVELAFLELMKPALAEAVDGLAGEGIQRITLVPLFLAQGGHLKEDLPKLLADIRKQHPAVRIDVTAAIGDAESLTNTIADWALAQHLNREP
jgi:sirohydrochlorin cobaltochelatase